MSTKDEIKKNIKNIELSIKKETDEILSSWEISNFLNTLNSSYYKIELINTVALAINNGVDIENLIIFSDSFNINTSYSYLKKNVLLDIDNTKDLKNFFHLGIPHSLIPNRMLFNMNILFEMFREINSLYYKSVINKIDKNKLSDLVKGVKEDQSHEMFEILEDIIKDHFSITKELNQEEKKDVKDKYEKTNRIIAKYKNKIKEFEKDYESLIDVIESIKKGEKIKINSELEKNFFLNFYKYLKSDSRPIIGIFNSKNRKIEIICPNHINKRSRDDRFFDVKKIEHNSPTLIYLCAGLPLLTIIGISFHNYKQRIENKKMERETEELKEIEFAKISEKIKQLNLNINTEELNAVKNMQNKIVKKEFEDILEKTKKDGANIVKKYGFENNNIEIVINEE